MDNPRTLKWLAFRTLITKIIKQNILYLKKKLEHMLKIEPNRFLLKNENISYAYILRALIADEREINHWQNLPVKTIVFDEFCPATLSLTFYMERSFFSTEYNCVSREESNYFRITKFLGGIINPHFEFIKTLLLANNINQIFRSIFFEEDSTDKERKQRLTPDTNIQRNIFFNEYLLIVGNLKYIIGNTKNKMCLASYREAELWKFFSLHQESDTTGLNLCERGYVSSLSYYHDFVALHNSFVMIDGNYDFCFGHPLLYMPENIHRMYTNADIQKLKLEFVLYDERGIPSNKMQFRKFLKNCQIYKSYLYLKNIVPHTTFINYARKQQKCKLL